MSTLSFQVLISLMIGHFTVWWPISTHSPRIGMSSSSHLSMPEAVFKKISIQGSEKRAKFDWCVNHSEKKDAFSHFASMAWTLIPTVSSLSQLLCHVNTQMDRFVALSDSGREWSSKKDSNKGTQQKIFKWRTHTILTPFFPLTEPFVLTLTIRSKYPTPNTDLNLTWSLNPQTSSTQHNNGVYTWTHTQSPFSKVTTSSSNECCPQFSWVGSPLPPAPNQHHLPLPSAPCRLP